MYNRKKEGKNIPGARDAVVLQAPAPALNAPHNIFSLTLIVVATVVVVVVAVVIVIYCCQRLLLSFVVVTFEVSRDIVL